MSEITDYINHWDEKFKSRPWGRYPPEDLVRFMGRNFSQGDRSHISVLEVGSGTGANLWFLHREGYRVAGIDGSSAGIEKSKERLALENKGLNKYDPDLKVGNFSTLPWSDNNFDIVIDIFAIYANNLKVIDATLKEVFRVLKPGGRFYSKVWSRNNTGYGLGKKIEEGTYDEIPSGPCQYMGVSHFFDKAEIEQVYKMFKLDTIDVLTRTDNSKNMLVEEYLCQFTKPLSGKV